MDRRISTPLLAQAAVYLYGVWKFSILFSDMDLWGHLRFGEALWTTGRMDWTDPYSYTAAGHDWINHEWLSEVLFFGLFDAFGSPGLILFKVLIGLVILHLLSRIYFDQQNHPFVYMVVFYLLIHIMLVGFRTRPHLLTWLFMAILLWMLYQSLQKNTRTLYGAPVLFLLWVNTHGGVTAGFGVFAVAVATDALQRRLNGQPQRRDVWICFALCGLVLLANPYGFRLWQFFLLTVPKQRDVVEWSSVPLFYPIFMHLKILTALFVATLFFKQPRSWWPLALILIGLYFGYNHLRHTVLTGMLMAPYTAVAWSEWLRERNLLKGADSGPGQWLPQLGLATAALVLTGALVQKGTATGYRIQVNPQVYPVAAVRFLKENKIGGHILLPFHWGEYAIWHLRDSRVSTDGRYWTVYPDDVLKANNRFHEGAPGWEGILGRFDHHLILTDHRNEELDRLPEWIKIYWDNAARIYLKRGHFENKTLSNPDTPLSTDFP